jgi:ribonuclease Y
MIWTLITLTGASLAVGFCLTSFLSRLFSQRVLNLANLEAQELLDEAKHSADSLLEEAKSRVADYEEELIDKFEKETSALAKKLQDHAEALNDRDADFKSQFHRKEDAYRRQAEELRKHESKVHTREKSLRARQEALEATRARYADQLAQQCGTSLDEIRSQIASRLESDHSVKTTKYWQVVDEEFQQEVEKTAKYIIRLVIDRFARPYCPERGIGNVEFDTVEIMQRTLGPDKKYLRLLEKECGVDIALNDMYISASVLGFDPVRRELGRASLERLSRERNPTENRVVDIVANTKRELFRKIHQDGKRIGDELRIKGLSLEIMNMMGTLRYRYSFAQNQYFHCGEVGFLCGLLSSELKLPVMDGRRAGLLHDIGKAMDHSIDGGHAVIGADFIQRYGEAPHIVHAVRAHHHDEPPSTDLAFLVIAADAISGARPGARRSTIDSYSQKMADLEKIGSSFEGVISTYIMSAGREVRIIVDSQRVDDHKALDLSKSIAKRIEEECSYPGLIKVTVVRETHAVDFAK